MRFAWFAIAGVLLAAPVSVAEPPGENDLPALEIAQRLSQYEWRSDRVEMLPPGAIAAPPGEPAVEIVGEIVAAPVEPCPPKKIWEGSIELGGNGSEGNSENFNLRFIVNVTRTTDWTVLTLNTRYTNNSTNDMTTVDRLFFEGRNEWLLADTPWSLYVHETTEYDAFRAFDVRLTADAGIGYEFFKTDLTLLKGRLGPGVAREIGGPDESFVPEGVMGLTFEHKLTVRSKITASGDYYPDLADFGEFRVNSQANWEFVLDEVLNLSLKLGVLNRYDSTPNGAKPNDLDYSATILWSF
jgi:putative salt-induced outer membrane protein YdiY